jgi:hypothetical protein
MFRIATRVAVIAAFVAVGWVAGHAQAPAPTAASTQTVVPPDRAGSSDFELVVTSVRGQTQVRCLRGCRLTWAPGENPTGGPTDMLAPDVKVDGTISPQGCLAPEWWQSNCHILGWKR